MNFRRHILRPGCVVLATLAGLSVARPVAAGDAIVFSKPAIAFATPPKVESDLPEARSRGMDFSDPDLERATMAPARPPQPIMRDPRVRERDEERDNTPRLLRTPKMFSDPDEEKSRKQDVTKERQRPPSPFMNDLTDQMRSDQTRGLSPVTELNWEPGDRANGKKESKRGGPGATSPFAYAERQDSPFGPETGRPLPFHDFSDSRPQEKITPAQMQRRTDFEQLLNPNAGPAAKGPDSLQPVVNAAEAKPGSLAMPTVGAGKFDPRASDPMAAYNQQRDRLRGPAVEDVNKRYNPAGNAAPGGGRAAGPQAPSGPQPLSRDFPSRKF